MGLSADKLNNMPIEEKDKIQIINLNSKANNIRIQCSQPETTAHEFLKGAEMALMLELSAVKLALDRLESQGNF